MEKVLAPSSENEDVTGERLLVENCLHLPAQTVETTTEVGHAGCKPDLRPGAKFNHCADFQGSNAATPDQCRSRH
jgi:hypothetical protein